MTKLKNKDKYLIGVISDTHGLLRPSVAKSFKDVDLIIHAGDIGGVPVMDELQKIAPLVAVRGNMDGGKWALQLPETEVIEIGSIMIYMLHDLYKLDIDPAAAGFKMVVTGHTHQPKLVRDNGVIFLNPGSAGPRRFDYPISAALIKIQETSLEPELIELDP